MSRSGLRNQQEPEFECTLPKFRNALETIRVNTVQGTLRNQGQSLLGLPQVFQASLTINS
jgi:hypothetical protein